MAGMTDNRNSPKQPFSVDSVTEIHRPPFKRGRSSAVFSVGWIGLAAGLFTLEQVLALVRIRCADGVAFVEMFCRPLPRAWGVAQGP